MSFRTAGYTGIPQSGFSSPFPRAAPPHHSEGVPAGDERYRQTVEPEESASLAKEDGFFGLDGVEKSQGRAGTPPE